MGPIPTGPGKTGIGPYAYGAGLPQRYVVPKATPTTTKAATTTKGKVTGIPTLDQMIARIYGGIETPAQQEARVNREVAAQIAAQQKMIEDMYARQRADALAMMQGQAAAGEAAAAMNKDLFGAVGGEFNAAAGEIKGLAHGLSKNAQGATAGDVSAANAGLTGLGNAPVTEGGTFGVGGGTQQGVEEYRGGTLPGQMFGTQGEAANFGLAGMIGAQNLQATQMAQAELHTTLSDLRGKETDAINALAAGRLDLYHQYKADAQDMRIKSLSLVQGLIAQKQATATSVAKMNQQAARDVLSQANKNRSFNLQYDKEGRMIAGQAFDQAATKTRIKISAAQLKIAQENAVRQSIKDMLAAGAIDVNRSKALGHVVDKTGKPVVDASGKQIPASMLGAAKGKTLTPAQAAAQAQKANQLASDLFYGYGTDAKGKRVPVSQIGAFNPDDSSTYGKGRVTYTKALQTLLRNKVSKPVAVAALNALYDRGDQGRPFFSQTERAAIAKAMGPVHFRGLLNTLNTYLQHNEIGNFDNLIAQTLRKYGLGG